MSKRISHTQAKKSINQFCKKGVGYRSFLHLAAQPLIFSTDFLYKLRLNFSTYSAKNDEPCRSYLVVSDLILSDICQPIGFNLFRLDDDIRNILLSKLDPDTRDYVAMFINKYAEFYKTKLSTNIYDIHRLWSKGILKHKELENEIKEKLLSGISDYEKVNYLSLYFGTIIPIREKGHKTKITLQIAENEYERNVLNLRLPKELLENIKSSPKNIKQIASSSSAIELIKMAKEKGWKKIDLGCTGLKKLPNELFELTELEELRLSNRVWDYKKFKWIDSINTGKDNVLTDLPQAISKLKKLEALYVGGDVTKKWKISDISALKELQHLRILYLNRNQISNISAIKQLSNLLSLDLSNNKITNISDLEALKKIKQLDLNHNHISGISTIKNLESLKVLYLNHNTISNIAPLKNLKNLRYLNLEFNKISDISYLSPLIEKGIPILFDKKEKEEGIIINDNPLINPPVEVVRQGNNEITKYFNELNRSGGVQIKEANIFLAGSGEVGKTSLRYRLNDKAHLLPQKEERTKQIDIDKYRFDIPPEGNFTAHIWDFGGQQIIHHFHRFYMNDSSLYILLTETSRENDDFDYWLQTIQLYGKDSPILFVQNKRNGMPRSLDISHYKNNFNIKEDLFNVNLLDNEGLDELEKAIQYHVQKLPHTQRTIPRSWLGIREALDRLKVDSSGYTTFEKFREICREQDITDRAKIEDVGQFMHRLGVVLWYKDNPVLRQKIILERHWATEGIFKLVFDEEIQKTGHFSFAQAQALWDTDDAYCHHTNDLIELMREFKICFPRKSQPDHYIIPALLTATAPHIEWKADNRMTVEYYYPTILPRGLINYLTAEMYDDIIDDAHAWSAGVWLHAGDTQAKIEENRFRRIIRITLSGTQHHELFGGIKKVVDNIHKDYPGMEPELRIPCICPTCTPAQQTDKEYYEYSDIIRRLERHKRTVECRKSYEDVPVKDLLNHILRREDYDETYHGGAKRIFVSYSHKDMAYKERLETAFAVQVRHDKVEIRNDQEILGGEDWNEEIFEHLEGADIIVLLFSPDFFASNFIWEKELPVVMRRYEDKSAKVFPVLLRPCDWMDTEYGKIQAVPSEDGKIKAISQWDDEDEAWQTVVHGIKKAIK